LGVFGGCSATIDPRTVGCGSRQLSHKKFQANLVHGEERPALTCLVLLAQNESWGPDGQNHGSHSTKEEFETNFIARTAKKAETIKKREL
jgi:hypothetical protein